MYLLQKMKLLPLFADYLSWHLALAREVQSTLMVGNLKTRKNGMTNKKVPIR